MTRQNSGEFIGILAVTVVSTDATLPSPLLKIVALVEYQVLSEHGREIVHVHPAGPAFRVVVFGRPISISYRVGRVGYIALVLSGMGDLRRNKRGERGRGGAGDDEDEGLEEEEGG